MSRPGHHSVLVVLLALLPASRAFADAEEASLSVEAGPALHRVEDGMGKGIDATQPGLRLSVRGTYGITNHLALDVNVGGILGAGTEFQDVPTPAGPQSPGILSQRQHALRVTAGATLRLGVTWIPTVTALVGFQERWFMAGDLMTEQGVLLDEDAGAGTSEDLLVGLGLGHDFRLGDRLVVGLSAQAVRAFPLGGNPGFEGIEIVAAGSWYWYPGW